MVQGSCQTEACPEAIASGFREGGLAFDGVNDLVTLSAINSQLDGAFSISLWVRPQSLPESGEQTVLNFTGSTPSLRLAYDSNGRFVFHGSSTVSSNDTFALASWHHLFLSIDTNNQAILTINGNRQATFNEATRPAATGTLQLGGSDFNGQLDELQLFSQALPTPALKQLIHNGEPVLWLPFSEDWSIDGSSLTDQSNWQHSTILNTSNNTNRAVPGAVGDFALQPQGTVQVAPHAALDLSHGEFTQALWVKYTNAPSNNQLLIGSSGETAQAYPSLYVTPNHGLRYGFGDGSAFVGGTVDGVLNGGQWHFVVVTFDGVAYQIYVDGTLRHRDDTLAGKVPSATETLMLGSPFASLAVDDVRLYGRILSASEIQMLKVAGWQTALTNAGQGSQPWSLSVPHNLEGLFALDVRATDALANTGRKVTLWQGAIDTLAPRVESVPATRGQGSSWQVTDFNLQETAVGDNCTITQPTSYYQAPWYLSLNGETNQSEERLYSAIITCTTEVPTVCDKQGNCLGNEIERYQLFLPVVVK